LVAVPLVFILSRYTTLPVIFLLGGYQVEQFIKCFIFGAVIKRERWIKNIVSE
jgi:Na+-driven multidrug efflux pump